MKHASIFLKGFEYQRYIRRLSLGTAFLFTVASGLFAQCILVVNDPQQVCEPSTVDLTIPEVTAGSSAGMTFTYWNDSLATISLVNPQQVAVGGTYYIKGTTVNDCSVVEPVKVNIIAIRIPVFNIPDEICLTGENPLPPELPQLSANGISGSWNPSSIPSAAGQYSFLFTSDALQCAPREFVLLVTVSEDYQKPQMSVPPTQNLAKNPDGFYTIPPAEITDDLDPDPEIFFEIIGSTERFGFGRDASGLFNQGSSTIYWTGSDGCNTVDATTTVNISWNSGIDPVTRSVSFRLYPNPADQTFTIEIQSLEPEDFTFTLADLTGRILFEKQIVRSSTTIREVIGHPDLAPGTYLARITGSSGTFSRMLVID